MGLGQLFRELGLVWVDEMDPRTTLLPHSFIWLNVCTFKQQQNVLLSSDLKSRCFRCWTPLGARPQTPEIGLRSRARHVSRSHFVPDAADFSCSDLFISLHSLLFLGKLNVSNSVLALEVSIKSPFDCREHVTDLFAN